MIKAAALTGPTASGKTAISLDIAERMNAEIICCDSMQIYKKMDIGTAKPTAEERARVRHHLTDFLSPEECFSAENYRAEAIKTALEISQRGKLALFVGGTGLYIDSVMRSGQKLVPESDPEYRERLLSSATDEQGIEALWQRLCSVDPESASKIHKNNVKRVIRALEIFDKTGRKKSEVDKESEESSEIEVKMVTLDFHNRENLYLRVEERVDIMIKEGLLSETDMLYREGLLDGVTTASQAIGYKELLPYIKGERSLEDCINDLKCATRRYAKRQLTWFRHERDARHLFLDTEDGIMRSYEDIKNEAFLVFEELLT